MAKFAPELPFAMRIAKRSPLYAAWSCGCCVNASAQIGRVFNRSGDLPRHDNHLSGLCIRNPDLVFLGKQQCHPGASTSSQYRLAWWHFNQGCLGVSDVALAKRCKRMKVPLPGRGYWAKKKGRRLSREHTSDTSGNKRSIDNFLLWAIIFKLWSRFSAVLCDPPGILRRNHG